MVPSGRTWCNLCLELKLIVHWAHVIRDAQVHGLEDPEAVTWTRRLKEYFELMNPGNPFPYYFRRRSVEP